MKQQKEKTWDISFLREIASPLKKDEAGQMNGPENVFRQVPDLIKRSRKEHFLGFYLNCRNQIIYQETISVGTLSASLVHPREVFAPGLIVGAASLIVVHNHPSGDITPSQEDKDTTKRLVDAGKLLGIQVLDHLIISRNEFFSFKEDGLI